MPIVQRQLDRPSRERTHPALEPAGFRRACCRSHERRKEYAALEKGAPWAEPVANHFIKKSYGIFNFKHLNDVSEQDK